MTANLLHQQYKASSHFDHTTLLPSFYALVPTLKHCMSRIDNMWVLEVVDEAGTYCLLFKPWELLRCAYIALLC